MFSQYLISKSIQHADLVRVFGWSELPILDWARFLTSAEMLRNPATSISLSPDFAEKVLLTLAKAWGNIPPTQASVIASTFQTVDCIPTKLGMKKPTEAYLQKVTLFEDCTYASGIV